jgi:hypothetical protein
MSLFITASGPAEVLWQQPAIFAISLSYFGSARQWTVVKVKDDLAVTECPLGFENVQQIIPVDRPLFGPRLAETKRMVAAALADIPIYERNQVRHAL